jgi:hypothetical protein
MIPRRETDHLRSSKIIEKIIKLNGPPSRAVSCGPFCQMSKKCLLNGDSSFEHWSGLWPLPATCTFNSTILSSLYSGTLIWLTTAANVDAEGAIRERLFRNPNARRAASWAATFAITMSGVILTYMLLYFLFGYGKVYAPLTGGEIKELRAMLEQKDSNDDVVE